MAWGGLGWPKGVRYHLLKLFIVLIFVGTSLNMEINVVGDPQIPQLVWLVLLLWLYGHVVLMMFMTFMIHNIGLFYVS